PQLTKAGGACTLLRRSAHGPPRRRDEVCVRDVDAWRTRVPCNAKQARLPAESGASTRRLRPAPAPPCLGRPGGELVFPARSRVAPRGTGARLERSPPASRRVA